MARRKKAPALLEIIRRDQQRGQGKSLGVPAWWDRPEDKDFPEALREPPPAPEKPAAVQAPAMPPKPGPTPPTETLPSEPLGPVLAWRNGCLTVNLDLVMAVVTAGVFVILLAGAFLLGRHTAGPPAAPEADQSQQAQAPPQDTSHPVMDLFVPPRTAAERQQKPTTPPTAPRESTPKTPRIEPRAPRPVQAPARQPGLTYLILQVFPSNAQATAEHAQAFLAQHGLATSLERMHSGQWRLVTRDGADAKTAEGAAKLNAWALQAKRIGDAYLKSGGRYRFHKPYPWTCPASKRNP